MKDFKSYAGGENSAGNGGSSGNGGSGGNPAGGQGAANVEQTVNMATMIAKAMSGKSEGQILQTILAQAEQGKRDGTLTNADLDNFYSAIYPMLDGFKRQKLKKIISQLKSI